MSRLQRNRFKVKLFQMAMGFANKLASLPNKLVPPPFRLIQMGSAYWQSRALYVATDLGIADALRDGRKTTHDIAEALDLHEDHLYRLLRMLASQGVFKECGGRCFRNNRLSAWLCKDHPQSVRSMVLLHNSPEISKPWFESLEPAIRSGEVPFTLNHGEELFTYMDSHPEFNALFPDAMGAVEGLTSTHFLRDFDWNRFERLIDVGGSNGSKSIAVLRRNQKLRALVYDRPQVIAGAVEYWRGELEPSLFERLEFSAGDMLESIPAALSNDDLYLFVAVFHAMGDKQAGQVLQNLRTACGRYRPTIVIADAVAQEQNIDPTIANFDMQMLIGTRGRERTLVEWRSLLEENDFAIRQMVEVRTFASLIVVRAAA